ncbi:hypothetical protein H920_13215 [Fukomys damarensis]|uniref:Uncharacterized protein n=1 Tax=Fukomys damarensis TaxID=885580 RepID=A0A091D040_FUKDA|nr:hypothetical protein H920_13215 [Fukomys damarensis]
MDLESQAHLLVLTVLTVTCTCWVDRCQEWLTAGGPMHGVVSPPGFVGNVSLPYSVKDGSFQISVFLGNATGNTETLDMEDEQVKKQELLCFLFSFWLISSLSARQVQRCRHQVTQVIFRFKPSYRTTGEIHHLAATAQCTAFTWQVEPRKALVSGLKEPLLTAPLRSSAASRPVSAEFAGHSPAELFPDPEGSQVVLRTITPTHLTSPPPCFLCAAYVENAPSNGFGSS